MVDFEAKAREVVKTLLRIHENRTWPMASLFSDTAWALISTALSEAEEAGFRRGVEAVLALPRPHTFQALRQSIAALLPERADGEDK